MGAIQLTDGKLCLVSPLTNVPYVAFSDHTVSHLLAPNHYHNKALLSYVERYPHTQICSSTAAKPRLEKNTGLTFKALTIIEKKLPKGFTFLEPKGLKTGEVWIKYPVEDACGWLVVDAFSGRQMSLEKHECKEPEMLKTFPSYGIADRDVYKKWVLNQIRNDKPTVIVPCHGSIVRNPNLPDILGNLVENI